MSKEQSARNRLRVLTAVLIAFMIAFTIGIASLASDGEQRTNAVKLSGMTQWIGAWEASQQPPRPGGISDRGFHNETVRMMIHPHLAGEALRIRLSNQYGEKPLTLGEVHVAIAGDGAETASGSDRPVTFDGAGSVKIPVGATIVSDAVSLPVAVGSDIAVSVYVPGESGPATWHAVSSATTYVAEGNQTNGAAFHKKVNAWFWLDGVDVKVDRPVDGAVVVLGDSITDGVHSTLNANHRWPDFLAERLHANGSSMSVLNAGISGNQFLQDTVRHGESALERLNRDVLTRSGVTDVILLEGINDIGISHNFHAQEIIFGMKEIIQEAHGHGLNIYIGTLLPFEGARPGYYTPQGEKTREALNEWIRTSGAFDGVIDFEKALRDPEHPLHLLPAYDSGDHLHPSDAGYKAMAEAVDLSMLQK
ncbi:MAG TPA: SGNH/GDSL hydrolase family protein [Bacillales bacterium]|nr:SGNH/GDSL hydrolase family protein [Bacillales bacterium]